MDEEEAAFRKKRNAMILNAIGGTLLLTFEPQDPLLLGEEFEQRSKILFDSLDKRRRRLVSYLSALPFDVIQSEFSERGFPTSPEQKAWFDRECLDMRRYAAKLTTWDRAQFDEKTGLADIDYWSKSAYLKMDEAVLLSAGLNPSEHAIRALNRGSDRGQLDPATAFLRQRRDLFRRALDPRQNDLKLAPGKVLRWIRQVNLEVHPRFRCILETIERAEESPQDVSSAPETEVSSEIGRIDPREKTSMAKLLVLIAIDAYGYDPRANRSPIPNEIEGIAHRNGVGLTAQTIRTYLKLGAEQLPKDWTKD